MTGEGQEHATSVSMVIAALAEAEAGADIVFKVRLSCSLACDFRGIQVRIVDAKDMAVVKETELAEFDGMVNETDEFVLKAPTQPGKYTWLAVFPVQEKQGVLHEESSASFSFVVKPHTPSVTILDVPDPVALDDPFKIKVGVKCSAGCELTGTQIEIVDRDGTRVAQAKLGDISLLEKTTLFCTEVTLQAPSIEGRYMWTVKFLKPDLELAHEQASTTFAFGVTRHAETVVTIEVIDRDTQTPIKDAHVIVRPRLYGGATFQGLTNEVGIARIHVPKDEYQVYVSKDAKEFFQPLVSVTGDMAIKAELVVKSAEPF